MRSNFLKPLSKNLSKQTPIYSGFGPATTAREVIEGIDLSGKVAVITGGYAGIGLETTRVLAEAGATVIGVPRHIHTREDEAYFVLSGELETIVGNKTFVLKAGETLMAPRNIPHALRNSGKVDNHYLIMFSPSGFEDFLIATSVPAPNTFAAR